MLFSLVLTLNCNEVVVVFLLDSFRVPELNKVLIIFISNFFQVRFWCPIVLCCSSEEFHYFVRAMKIIIYSKLLSS